MEPVIKRHGGGWGTLENSEQKTGGLEMKKITMVVAMMCAISAYVAYPSANASNARETLSPLAISMQETRSLPVESWDAV